MHAGCYVSGRNRLEEGGLRGCCLFFLFKMKTPTKFWLLVSLWNGDETWILTAIKRREGRRGGRIRIDEWMAGLDRKGEQGVVSVCIHTLLSLHWQMLCLLDHPKLIWRFCTLLSKRFLVNYLELQTFRALEAWQKYTLCPCQLPITKGQQDLVSFAREELKGLNKHANTCASRLTKSVLLSLVLCG